MTSLNWRTKMIFHLFSFPTHTSIGQLAHKNQLNIQSIDWTLKNSVRKKWTKISRRAPPSTTHVNMYARVNTRNRKVYACIAQFIIRLIVSVRITPQSIAIDWIIVTSSIVAGADSKSNSIRFNNDIQTNRRRVHAHACVCVWVVVCRSRAASRNDFFDSIHNLLPLHLFLTSSFVCVCVRRRRWWWPARRRLEEPHTYTDAHRRRTQKHFVH